MLYLAWKPKTLFFWQKEVQAEMQELALLPNERSRSVCSAIWNLWKFQWWKFLFLLKKKNSKKEHKD